MYFNAAALVALLPVFGAATSFIKSSGDADNNNNLILRDPANAGSDGDGYNTCDLSTFVEVSQPDSAKPLVTDCQAMLQKIQTDRSWIVWQGGYRRLVDSGTCAFNAIAQGTDGSKAVMGNQDVIDLVTDSIKKYARDGRVGAKGTVGVFVNSAGGVPCNKFRDATKKVLVDWTVTHV